VWDIMSFADLIGKKIVKEYDRDNYDLGAYFD